MRTASVDGGGHQAHANASSLRPGRGPTAGSPLIRLSQRRHAHDQSGRRNLVPRRSSKVRSYPEPLRGTCKTTLDSAIKYFDRSTRSFKLLPIKLVSRMSANEASATMTCLGKQGTADGCLLQSWKSCGRANAANTRTYPAGKASWSSSALRRL